MWRGLHTGLFRGPNLKSRQPRFLVVSRVETQNEVRANFFACLGSCLRNRNRLTTSLLAAPCVWISCHRFLAALALAYGETGPKTFLKGSSGKFNTVELSAVFGHFIYSTPFRLFSLGGSGKVGMRLTRLVPSDFLGSRLSSGTVRES